MKNPFPGVNPFIEAEGFWEDFHRRFVSYLCEAMLTRLPERYDARIDERVDLVDPDTGKSVRIPDVSVLDRKHSSARLGIESESVSTVATAEVEQLPVEEYREVWIDVRDMRDNSLVTSIEVLSPTNKSPGGFNTFKHKRLQLLEGGASLVDIDLLLAGERLHFRQPLPPADYYTFISRSVRRPKTEVIAWPVQAALPSVPIPLRSPDPDLIIDLQEVYRTTFERGQYPRRLRYKAPLSHPDKDVRDWARSIAPSV